MLLQWLRSRRRRRLLAEPFPEAWSGYLQSNLACWRFLNDEARRRLRDLVHIFIAEKTWEGCGTLELTDEIRVTIAAQACLLLLGLDESFEVYPNVHSVLVYPTHYETQWESAGPGDVVVEELTDMLGEAHWQGPVILTWDAARHGGLDHDDGLNLVMHEFAHKLDMLNGLMNGTPPLKSDADYERWRQVMAGEFEALRKASGRGRATLLDHYGATDECEFFAVATECFFEKPSRMVRRHPKLYDVLRSFYGQDPASWW